MEENNVSVKSVSIKWGIINGLISIIFFVLIDILGLIGNQAIQWLSAVIFIIILVLAHKEFKNDGDSFMTYGQGLGIGTLTAVISGVLGSIFTFIYVSFINTGYIDSIKENQIMQFENKGMSDAEIEQAMSFSEGFMTPGAITGFSLFFGILFGFIISLIVTIFTKKNKPEAI